MGLSINDSSEGASGSLYTGVMGLEVVAVNPTQEEKKALGFKADKETDYIHPEYGTMVNFYLKGEIGENTFHIPHTIFLKDENVKTKAGDKWQCMDDFGRSAYLTKQDISTKSSAYEWFNAATLRGAKKGEADLYEFLMVLCNPKKGELFKLDNLEKIIKGDMTEIRLAIQAAAGNRIKSLVGVKDEKYMVVYPKKFERAYSNNLSYLHKSFVENGPYFLGKGHYYGEIDMFLFNPNDFKVKPFEGIGQLQEAEAPQQTAGDPFGSVSSNGSGATKSSAFMEDEDDGGLPF